MRCMGDDIVSSPARVPGPLLDAGVAFAIEDFRRKAAAVVAAKRNPATRRGYTHELTTWLRFCGENSIDPHRAQLAHSVAYRDGLLALPTPRGKIRAGGTIARALRALSSIYRRLRNMGALTFNPFAGEVLDCPDSSPHTPAEFVERADYDRMLAAAQGNHRDATILEVLWWTGLRSAEVASLRAETIHLEGPAPHAIVGRKGGKPGPGFLAPSAVAALTVWLAASGIKEGPVFACATHDATAGTIYEVVRKYARIAGVTARVHPHGFRATMITTLLDETSLQEAQGMAGHASPTTTMRYDRKIRGAAGARALEEAREKPEPEPKT